MFLDIRLQHVQRETTVSRDNSTRRMESKSSGTVQGGIDDDEEPVLKYQRMGADVGKLLSTGSGFSNSMTSSDGLGDDGKRSSSNSVDREEVVRMAVHDSYLVRYETANTEAKRPWATDRLYPWNQSSKSIKYCFPVLISL